MEKNIEVTLPSGKILKVTAAPFAEAKDLYESMLEQLSDLKIESNTEMLAIYKDLFCKTFSNKRVAKALEACLKRSTYDNKRIDDTVFEPLDAREDYILVLWEVAQHNLAPFMKNLSAVFSLMAEKVQPGLK